MINVNIIYIGRVAKDVISWPSGESPCYGECGDGDSEIHTILCILWF